MHSPSVSEPGRPSGHLLHNLLLFGRLLRGLGLDVSPGRLIDLVHALSHISIDRRHDFYHAARSLLVRRREDIPLFDRAFEMFWRSPEDGWLTPDHEQYSSPSGSARDSTFVPLPSGDPEEGAAPEEWRTTSADDTSPVSPVVLTYSQREVLRRKDFAELTGDELAAIRRMISEITWSLGQRRTRRLKPGSGSLPDFRRTLRHSLKHGGEILSWAGLKRKYKPRPLVILADVSGSMEGYSRLLLHFVYAVTRGFEQGVEAFLFGTRLTRVTRQIRLSDADRAVRQVARAVPDWSGGTRIGEALKAFNFEWGRRVMGRGAAVLLISDGWDRGDVKLLSREMARLHRSASRLIWLNPLLGTPDYEPVTRGMQAALPYVDDFLPVHNLASLEHLAGHLASLDDRTRDWTRARNPVRGSHSSQSRKSLGETKR